MIADPHGPLYSVVCTDTNPYGAWQVDFLEHSWLRANMPGELVHLVATPNREELPRHHTARVVRTSASNSHPRLNAEYMGMNRLLSLQEWLESERPVGNVLILDCDFVFRAALDRRATPGHPIGQDWYDYGVGEIWSLAAEEMSPGVTSRVQPVTWPFFIHTSDLRRIIARWIEVTVRLRNETNMWESDMFALTIVLAEYDLTCELEMFAAWMPWPEEVVGDAPIIHYCQPVLDSSGDTLWFKQSYTPWEDISVDPDDAALDYCRELLTMFNQFAGLRRAAEGFL